MLRGRGELDINAGTEALSAPPKSDLRGPFETDQRKAGHLRFSIIEKFLVFAFGSWSSRQRRAPNSVPEQSYPQILL